MTIKQEEPTSPKIKAAMIAHVYQLLHLGQLTSLFCATIIVVGLFYDYRDNTLILSWYAFYLSVFLVRLIILKSYLRQQQPDTIFWRNLFIFSSFIGGLCWGLAGSFVFYHAASAEQILIILIIGGVTAGAAPLLAAELISSFVFMSTALLPTTFFLLFIDTNSIYPLFGIAAVGYYFYLLALCMRLYDIIKNSIGLKFENDILLSNISQTKSQLEAINQQLAHAATHDPLTNLANRNLFEYKLIKAIARAQQNNSILALLYIDLDNFKDINDAYGHHVGDQLLLQLIERIRKNTRQSDTIARLGGDELTIILENIAHAEIIPLTANRLCGILGMPVVIHNDTIAVTASIGISVYPEDGEDIETLLKNADKAMYYVKQHGRNNYRFSSPKNDDDHRSTLMRQSE